MRQTVPSDNNGGPLGVTDSVVSLNAVTANGAGVVADFRSSRFAASVVVSTTGGPTGGTVTLMASVDGATFFTTATTAAVGAGVTAGTLNVGAYRYFRADLSGLTGGASPTVTAKVMAV